jgi:hypothetical protein
MLRIQRYSKEGVVLSLSGRIEIADIGELERLLSLEAASEAIALDLQEVTLIDREAVPFLAHCEAKNVRLERCPAYIRDWIDAERGRKAQTGGSSLAKG